MAQILAYEERLLKRREIYLGTTIMIQFIIGFLFGGLFSVIIMSLVVAAKRGDKDV